MNIDTHAAAGRALEAFLTDGVEPTGQLPPALLPHGGPLHEPRVGGFVSRTCSMNRLSTIYAVKNVIAMLTYVCNWHMYTRWIIIHVDYF